MTHFKFDKAFSHEAKKDIERLLVGRRIVRVDLVGGVEGSHFALDDGTVVKLLGNVGCAGCPSGSYDLTHLEGVDNVITAVGFNDSPNDSYGEGIYQIFVFANNEQVNLATFEGTDGNGYYGTGYHLLVRYPKAEEGR